MKEKIEMMLQYLPLITKDEAELIASVCKWHPEKQAAFLLAKTIFEENIDENNSI